MSPAEAERVRLLHALNLLDSEPEPAFDRITRLLARALEVPYALISLVGSDRQWFKSPVGLDVAQAPREIVFCTRAIEQSEPLIVEDAALDPRFADNPLVTRAPHVRFYGGIPLRTSDGHALGTLCVLDSRPRTLSAEQLQVFQDLADLATREIRLRESRQLSHGLLEHGDQMLEQSESRFRIIFERAGVGIAMVGRDGHWLEVNDELCKILGYRRAELDGLTFQDVTLPEDLPADFARREQLLSGEVDRYQLEKRYVRRDGRTVWVRLLVTGHYLDGQLDYFVAVVQDIQARKEAEASLAAQNEDLERRVQARTQELYEANLALSEAMTRQVQSAQVLRKREAELTAILETANDAYISMNEAGQITAWNRMAEMTFGWSREEALGQNLEELIIPAHQHDMHRHSVAHYNRGGEAKMVGQRREVLARRRDGSLFPIEVRVSVVETDGQKIFSAFLHEISERKLLEERREREALQDPLTGLPNRRALFENLTRAMERTRRKQVDLALMFLDLDGFKEVNDRLGHDAGDTLLREIADRLRRSLRANDSVYRLAGDEFTVVLEGLSEPRADAHRIAEKILHAVTEPLRLGADEAQVGTSIGITVYSANDARSLEQLLRDADAAMYDAKRTGKGCIRLR